MPSPADRTYAIIAETVPGTFPPTGSLIPLDYIPGSRPSFSANQLQSQTLSKDRASWGSRRVAYAVGGSTRLHFCRDAAVELLLESALSGAWVVDVLKAGSTDRSVSIEERLKDGASSLYQRFLGVQVSGFTLDCAYDGNAEAAFDFVGMSRVTATTSALSYDTVGTKLKLAGPDVKNLTIAGLTGAGNADFVNLSLSVSHNREVLGGFGTTDARGVGTSGNRVSTLSLSFYREDFSPESVIGDGPVAVSFEIGEEEEGYKITLPAAYGSIPTDTDDGAKALVSVDFTAGLSTVEGTDIKIERLSA